MAQVRKTIRTNYLVSKSRERAIYTGIGATLWRAMRRGEIRAGPELAKFMRDLLQRLSDARGVGDKVRAWCSWGGWTVRTLVNERTAHARELEETDHLIARIREEREKSRNEFQTFLDEMGVSNLREYISQVAG